MVIAQSNPEWFVAKPIERLGGPGLIPVAFVNLRYTNDHSEVTDPVEAIRAAGVPRVEEWKSKAAWYKNNSVPLGRLGSQPQGSQQSLPDSMSRLSVGTGQSRKSQDTYRDVSRAISTTTMMLLVLTDRTEPTSIESAQSSSNVQLLKSEIHTLERRRDRPDERLRVRRVPLQDRSPDARRQLMGLKTILQAVLRSPEPILPQIPCGIRPTERSRPDHPHNTRTSTDHHIRHLETTTTIHQYVRAHGTTTAWLHQ